MSGFGLSTTDPKLLAAIDQLKEQVRQSQEGAELLAQALQGFAGEVRKRLDKLEQHMEKSNALRDDTKSVEL